MTKPFGHPNDVSIPSSTPLLEVAACLLESAAQHLRDWQLERRIQRLSRQCVEALSAGDKPKAYLLDATRMDAIIDRSPAQVARMERRMGLR